MTGRRTRRRDERADVVVDCLREAFSDLMEADPAAFRTKFRKMARDPFAFYRGSASVFYRDLAGGGSFGESDERWAGGAASRVWIQGDLHCENFGTYLDSDGRLVFDVNDFDEAYVGPWTWDLRRFVASLALLCWQKALPDEVIDEMVSTYVRAYVDHVHHYVEAADDTEWALTLDTARGHVLETLQAAKLSTRFGLLESVTVVDDYRRTFASRAGVRRLEDDELQRVLAAFAAYVDTIPESKKATTVMFDVLDVVGKAGFGIGSAGLPAYNVLIEGFNQALDNDVVLTMKQGNAAAPGRVVTDQRVHDFFRHHGHRTVLSERSLQAHADRFLGWTEVDDVGYVVSEFSPYELDVDWGDVNEPDEMALLVEQLGRATAKIHCVADDDSDHDLVDVSVEMEVAERVGDDVDGLVEDLRTFAHAYAEQVRTDHRLFVDSFRGGAFARVAPTT
ncbi:MAG: DUF2252 domain-containing protein [Actinomycetes bacterium]